MQVAWVTARRYLLVIVEVLPVDDRCTLTLRLGTLCIFSTTSACCVGRVGLGRLLQPGLAREVLLLLQPHIWQVFIIVLAARFVIPIFESIAPGDLSALIIRITIFKIVADGF